MKQSDVVVAGVIGGAILVVGWLVMVSPKKVDEMPAAERREKAAAELGSDMPESARDALYPETVPMVSKTGTVASIPVDKWQKAWGLLYRFDPSASIDVEDGGKRFKLSGSELNSLVDTDRFGLGWRLHGPRRKIE